MHEKKNNILTFNVSGHIFETKLKTLEFFPDTILGNENRREQFYCKATNQYFINRHRFSFESILYFYQSKGRLYLPHECSLQYFLKECRFYGLPDFAINILKTKEKGYLRDKIRETYNPIKIDNLTLKRKIWHSIENPGSSIYAACFFSLQISAIFLSVTICIIESYHQNESPLNSHNVIIELTLSIWFLFEFILRIIVAPNKINFLCSIANWIDLFAIFPATLIYGLTENSKFNVLKEARFLRVLRILRLRKVSARTKCVCIILKDSLEDLFLFLVGFIIAVICGGSMLYHIESIAFDSNGDQGQQGAVGSENQFISIPQGMWWAVQSFLTVGYGDVIPQSVPGKIFSAFFMVLGMDTVLLPVLSLIMKFAEFVANPDISENGEE